MQAFKCDRCGVFADGRGLWSGGYKQLIHGDWHDPHVTSIQVTVKITLMVKGTELDAALCNNCFQTLAHADTIV